MAIRANLINPGYPCAVLIAPQMQIITYHQNHKNPRSIPREARRHLNFAGLMIKQ